MANKKISKKRLTKRQLLVFQRRRCQAMGQKRKIKKKIDTSQDPVVGDADIKPVKLEINVECENNEEENNLELELEEIEEVIESNDVKKSEYESGSDVLRQTQPNEELWVVRRQLCRGCHSDGAFWSLQTVTEGDTYGDLLQTYCNIQLCPVSNDEHALSAICTLCAARLREARAFSAQVRAAEEHFTSLYIQNRVRALASAVGIKKEVDVPEKVNEVDNLEISEEDVPDTANSDVDYPEVSIEELAPKLIENKDIQVRCYKPTSKISPVKKLVTNEDTQKISSEVIFRLSPSDYQRIGKSFKCTRCDKIYCKRGGILNHVKNVHFKSTNDILSCSRCDKTFKKSSDYNSHKKKEHSIIYKEKSKRYALSPSDFERVGSLYKCTRCEKQLKDIKAIRNHVMYIHLKLPRYPCPHCDQTFKLLAPFTRHKLNEHSIDHRIKCNACDAKFNNSTQLIRHKNNFHMLGIRRTCPSPDCDYFCFSGCVMKKHVVKHSTVKEHHCKYCKKSFLRKSTLNFHERIHTGDKRQVCNVCGQAFVQRASLTYHMAKHHPEVRF